MSEMWRFWMQVRRHLSRWWLSGHPCIHEHLSDSPSPTRAPEVNFKRQEMVWSMVIMYIMILQNGVTHIPYLNYTSTIHSIAEYLLGWRVHGHSLSPPADDAYEDDKY